MVTVSQFTKIIFKVVRTVCTENTEVVNNQVCATYYAETKVQAEVRTVTATFEKVCRAEEVRNLRNIILIITVGLLEGLFTCWPLRNSRLRV